MLSYVLEISERARKDIQALDNVTRRRIVVKLKYFLAQGDPLAFAKRLTNSEDGDYRWRIGPYRVVFDARPVVILILRVQHRSEVYKSR